MEIFPIASSRGKSNVLTNINSTTTVGNGGTIRLLQYAPAWTLHCLLRFRKISYTCENCVSHDGLSLKLPIIVDGNFVFSERLAIEHISKLTTSGNDGDGNNHDDLSLTHHLEVALIAVYNQLLISSADVSDGRIGTQGRKLSFITRIFGKIQHELKKLIYEE
jgi:hypothetical protein